MAGWKYICRSLNCYANIYTSYFSLLLICLLASHSAFCLHFSIDFCSSTANLLGESWRALPWFSTNNYTWLELAACKSSMKKLFRHSVVRLLVCFSKLTYIQVLVLNGMFGVCGARVVTRYAIVYAGLSDFMTWRALQEEALNSFFT